MAHGLRKLIRRTRKQFINHSKLTRRLNRFGPRLRVEELEERIAPAITVFGTIADGGDGNTTVTLDQVGDGFIFTETDGDVWALALVADVGTEGTALTSGNVVITLTANDTAASQEIDSIDFGNSVALTAGDNVGIVFQLNTAVGNGLLDVAAGDAVIDGNNSNVLGVFGVSVTDGTLNAASDVGTTPTVNATMSSRLDFAGANVNMGGSLTQLYVGAIDDITVASMTTLSVDDASGASGDVAAITTTGDFGALSVDGSLTGAIGIGDQIIGAWAVTGNIDNAADITTANGTTAAGAIAVTGNMVGNLVSSAGILAGNVTVTGTLSGAITGDDGISGNIQADTISGAITVTDGDLSGDITTTGDVGSGNIGNITVDTGGTGNITNAVTITSAGTIGTITVGNDLAGDITAASTITGIVVEDGSITADSVTSAGGTITAVTVDADESGTNETISGTITTTAGNIGTLDVGGNITAAITSAGTIGTITSDGNVSAAITAATGVTGNVQIDNGITSTGSLVATTGDIAGTITINTVGLAGAITATAGSITNTVTITAGGAASTGSITAGTNISGNIVITAGDFAADVTATAGSIANVTLTAGNSGNITSDASFTSGTTIGTITADVDFAGDVTAGTTIAGVVSADGDITTDAVITAGGTITLLRADENESGGAGKGDIEAAVSTTAGDITTIDAGGNITGVLTAFAQIGTVTADGSLQSAVTAGTGFTGNIQIDDGITSTGQIVATTGNIAGTVTITTGGVAGTIKATAGDIDNTVTITAGGLTATGVIQAGVEIDGAVTVTAGGVAGTIIAGTNIDGLVTITAGGLSGSIEATGGNIGAGGVLISDGGVTTTGEISAGLDIDGNITTAGTGNVAGTIEAGVNIDGDITIDDSLTADGSISTVSGNINGDITATNGDIAGDILTGGSGDINGDIDAAAGAITGLIGTSVGDLTGSVTAGAGNIANIYIGGNIDTTASGGNVTIQATGGSVSITAANGGIITDGGNDLDILGDTGVTITTGTVTSTNGVISIDGDDDGVATFGNTTITTTGAWTNTDQIDIDGYDITITSGGNFAATSVNPDNDLTSLAVTGTLTAGTITPTNDAVSITATSTITITTLTAGNDITSVTSDGNINITTATAANDVTSISTPGAIAVTNVTATAGDVVSVAADNDDSGVGTLTIGGLIRAVAGDVLSVSGAGVTGNITATLGEVVSVDAGAGEYTGTITSNVADAAANVLLTVIDEGIIHTIETDAGASDARFAIVFTGAGAATNSATIDMTVLAGSGWDVDLKTNTSINDEPFNLAGFTLNAATTSYTLGTITVEGSVTSSIVLGSLINPASLDGLIVQEVLFDGATEFLQINSIDVIAARQIRGADATAALADDATFTIGTPDPNATAADGTFRIPVSPSGTVQIFAAGAGETSFAPTAPAVGFLTGVDAEASITFTAGVITDLSGGGTDAGIILSSGIGAAGLDLSSFSGAIIVGGDVDGILTLGDNDGLTVNGDVNAEITGTDVDIDGDLAVTGAVAAAITIDTITGTINIDGGVSAAITVENTGSLAVAVGAVDIEGDVSGAFTIGNGGDVDGDFDINGDVSGVISIADVNGDFSIGDAAAAVTVGNVDGDVSVDSVTAALVFGDVTDGDVNIADGLGESIGAAVTIGDVTDGDVTLGDIAAASGGVTVGDVDGDFDAGDVADTLDVGAVDGDMTVDDVSAAVSVTSVDGDLDTGVLSATFDVGDVDGDLTVGGDVSGALTAGDVSGDVDINGSATAAVTVGTSDSFDVSGSTSGSGVVTAGNVANNFNITGAVDANATVGTVGGTFNTGAIGGATDVTVSAGDITGAATVASLGDDSTLDLDLINGGLTVTGAMNGTLIVNEGAGDNSGNAVAMGSMGSAVLVIGSLASVTATGDLGLATSIIAATEHIGAITSTTGSVLSSIFTGGDGVSAMAISAATVGETVSGAIAVGQRDGVTGLTVNSGTDIDVMNLTAGAAAVAAAAGNFSGVTDVFDVIILGAGAGDLNVTNTAGSDGANVGNIFIGDDYGNDINVAEQITGIITVNDDADMSVLLDDTTIFNALASGLTDPGEVANAATLATALDNLGTSALELVFGDDGGTVDFTGSVAAENVGGLEVAGNIGTAGVLVEVDVVDSMGHVVSLNGSVHASVHAGISIGSIVASEDITGEYMSEGTLGLDSLDGSTIDGVPNWFQGGILAEVGTIGASGNPVLFAAQAGTTLVDGLLVPSGSAMGTIYVLAGNIYASVDSFGDFGGLVAGAGAGSVNLSVPDTASIDYLIAPNISISGSYNDNNVGTLALSGANVLVGGQTAQFRHMSVGLVGTGILAVVDPSITSFDCIWITGLDQNNQVNIVGDVDELIIDGSWVGSVTVQGAVLDDTDGVVGTVEVDGNVDSTYADFEAYSFGDFVVSGTNGQMASGTLDGGDSVDWTNLNSDSQIMYLRGGSNVSADWTSIFGQMNEVEISGRGAANLLSMNYDTTAPTVTEMNQILNRVPKGWAGAYEMGEGTAHVGEVSVDGYNNKLKLRNVLVDGNLGSLEVAVNQAMKSLWVSGGAGEISVARAINRAFIGDGVNLFATGTARNVVIDDSVGIMSLARAKNVTVQGTTGALHVAGKVIDSQFLGSVGNVDIAGRIIRSSINGQLT